MATYSTLVTAITASGTPEEGGGRGRRGIKFFSFSQCISEIGTNVKQMFIELADLTALSVRRLLTLL